MTKDSQFPPRGQMIVFQNDQGDAQVECRLESDTLWLTQGQMADLYQKSVPTINEHLVNIYEEGELD